MTRSIGTVMSGMVLAAATCLATAGANAVELSELKGEIIFSSDRSGSWAIWSIGANGKGLKQISKPGAGEMDVDPVWSPDGKSILFTSTRGGQAGIWVMNADGTEPRRICDGGQAEWLPDGKAIVFIRDEKVYTRDLASGEEKLISDKDWPHCSGPVWSPDGKTIAFAARWDGPNAVYTIPAEGGEATKVYDKKPACGVDWSPDGTMLAYETEVHICKIQPDGQKNRQLTFFGGVQRFPRWSPDGKHIVFCQGVSEKGPWELYIISSDGGTPARPPDGASDMNPDWK